jgi:V8-like Glu-specific endopeptidase
VAVDKKNALDAQSFEALESPFLSRETHAGQREKDWGPRLEALEAESPFLGSFEPIVPGVHEREENEEENQLTSKRCTGIIGNDDRVPVRQAWDIPFRWICQISSRRRKGGTQQKFGPAGTGILISPRFVLTAAHVLRSSEKDNRGQWVDSESEYVVVTPALNESASTGNTAPFGKFEAKSWKLAPQYNPRSADSWKYDDAVIELKDPAGAKRAPILKNDLLCFWGSRECGGNTNLEVLAAKDLAGKTAYTAGYPADLGGGTRVYSTSGMLSSVDIRGRREIMNYDADGCPGQSGSPIWIERDGKRFLVGIFTKVGTGYDAATGTVTLNNAVRITQEVFDQISHWFEAVLETPWLDARKSSEPEASGSPDVTESHEEPENDELDSSLESERVDDSEAVQLEDEQVETESVADVDDRRNELEEFGPEFQLDTPKSDEPARPPFPDSFKHPWLWHEDVTLRRAFQEAMRTVQDAGHKRAYDANGALPDASKIPIVIAWIGPGGRPSFAGQNMSRMYYSGSLLKVAAMYGAFQLRKAVADFANTLPSGLAQDQVFQRFHRAFNAKILGSAPTLPEAARSVPKYADVLKVTPDGAHYKIEFLKLGDQSRRDFDFHLHEMVEKSHNPSAGVCVQGLGYSWINGVLRAADFFAEDPKEPRDGLDRFRGIWLAGDYLLPSGIINAEHQKFLKHQAEASRGVPVTARTKFDRDAEDEFELGISGRAEVRIPSVNDGPSKQAASCLDLVNMMVQVANANLIPGDAAGSASIGNMLTQAVGMSIIGRFAPSAHFSVLQSKIGFGTLGRTGSCNADSSGHTRGCVLSEALVIQETAPPNRKYAVVYQDIQDPSNHGNQDLVRIRDIIDVTIDKF